MKALLLWTLRKVAWLLYCATAAMLVNAPFAHGWDYTPLEDVNPYPEGRGDDMWSGRRDGRLGISPYDSDISGSYAAGWADERAEQRHEELLEELRDADR